MQTISSNFVGGWGGLLMSCIAFSIVFIVIAGLMLMMMALKAFVNTVNPEQKGGGATPASPVSEPASTQQVPTNITASVPLSADQDDGELVAVLTAAITAMTGYSAAVLSYAPTLPNAPARNSTLPWRMTSILNNSRGLRD
jgi:Na+-transporting methylmalonyl-CoA/oxaloacetate decarboxylase gamma subunit